MTVTPVSDIPVSIDYTGRDYYSLRDDIIARIQARIADWTASDPADFGVAIAEAFAYVGDVISYYIDRIANEAFITTATQRDSLLALSNMYGYTPSGYRQASLTLQFSNADVRGVTVPAGTVVTANVTVGTSVYTLNYTTVADLYVPAASGSVPGTATVIALEGESVTLVSPTATTYGELVGTSDGTPSQAFMLGETPVVDGSLTVYVQDGTVYSKWTQVQHLLDYGPADLVYSVFTDANYNVHVQFGDGVSGAIPVIYSEVRVLYTVGGGTLGNIATSLANTITYVPGLSEAQITALQSTLTVTNTSVGLGGSDPESNEQIREAAPQALRALNRAVTLADFSSLAYNVTNVGKAQATASVWNSVTLYVAPARTAIDTDPAPGLDSLGNPTTEFTALKSAVSTFLADKLLIGSSLTIQPPIYTDVVVSIQYVKYAQYTTTEVEADIKAAILSAFGYVNLSFEQTIYPQDIEAVVNTLSGVVTSKVQGLHTIPTTGLNTLVGAPNEIFRFTEANLSVGALV